jgi:hypothetical protein
MSWTKRRIKVVRVFPPLQGRRRMERRDGAGSLARTARDGVNISGTGYEPEIVYNNRIERPLED